MKQTSENKKTKSYVGLGSNLGNRLGNIRFALAAMGQMPGSSVLRMSAVYETEPYGNPGQPKFLNAAVEIETALEPTTLLKSLQRIEHHLGRVRQAKWEPRVIDLDILYFGNQVIDTPELKVPHPELSLRRFALVPLCDLIPEFEDPTSRQKVKVLLQKISRTHKDIIKLETVNF
ncbi:2-amino-4-hydroxy-6-hydroxymethyldihydropteridine diphosphokinase [candidate division TA06 bacterium]|uniref:2-amino-4-hydroxy-6-hydroxymethyldihydropteridine diphosphokinase n=1 Tax=candidate division TA06 bacterium TaxID=2250710 RepID=A0A933ICE1_UNCT6|nr:2-amino-4-hydroxy-6-hydroxymethyldihydropteridine diphosphokinase [candidate division TA06 bacterium]